MHPDRADLPLRGGRWADFGTPGPVIGPSAGGLGPDAGQALDRARGDAVLRERLDHHPLQPPHVLVDVVAVGAQGDDRVGDQLAGAVVGDAAAAVGVAHLDSLPFVPLGSHRQLLRGRAAAAGVNGGVLEQQQHVGDLLALARSLQAQLCLARLLIGHDSAADNQDLGAHP